MKKIKIWIAILTIILVLIIIALILITKDRTPKTNTSDINSIMEGNSITSNTVDNTYDIDNSINNETLDNSKLNMSNKLQKEENKAIYFLLKQCMAKYYDNSTSLAGEETLGENTTEELEPLEDELWYLIDDEAKKLLGLNKENLAEIHEEVELPKFVIDMIYSQKLSETQNIYIIYNRIEGIEEKQDKILLIRLDTKNNTFSAYPQKYLQERGLDKLKEGDSIKIDNLQEIPSNGYNLYNTDEIEENDLVYLKELYEKYKFDLYYDVEHLYNSLNEEYKNQNYGNYDEFNNFIETHRQELESDEMQKYRTADTNNGTELIGIGTSGRNYIFDMTNLTEYDVRLDGYSSVTEEYMKNYNMVLPEGKGRYSINRIFNAINEKNYKFLYDKLNDVQKQNYYPTYEEFVKFIQNNLFEENNAEILESGQNTATDVYQYLVEVKDLAGGNNHKIFTIVIFLGQNGDFKFGITN